MLIQHILEAVNSPPKRPSLSGVVPQSGTQPSDLVRPPASPSQGQGPSRWVGLFEAEPEGHGAPGIVCKLPCASECICKPAAPRSRSVRPAVPCAEGLPCRRGGPSLGGGNPPSHFLRRLPIGKLRLRG